jgi:hypothetical protein
VLAPGRRRADGLDCQLHRDLAGPLETEHDRDPFPFDQRVAQAHEQQVHAAGRELDRLAGRDGNALYRAHARDAVGEGRLVDLDPLGDFAGHRDQAVLRGAGVGQREVPRPGPRGWRRGAGEGVAHLDRAGREVVGRGFARDGEQYGGDEQP